MARSRAEVNSCGLTAQPIREISLRIISTGTAFINGQTAESTKEPGRTTRCMDMAFLLGLMVGGTKETTRMIRSKGKEPSSGLTDADTSGAGLMESSTEKGSISRLQALREEESGRTESVSSGWERRKKRRMKRTTRASQESRSE